MFSSLWSLTYPFVVRRTVGGGAGDGAPSAAYVTMVAAVGDGVNDEWRDAMALFLAACFSFSFCASFILVSSALLGSFRSFS